MSVKEKIIDKSTESKGVYLFFQIFYSVIVGMDTLWLLPYLIPIAKIEESYFYIILSMAITGIVGLAATYRYGRTYWNIIKTLLSGVGLYVILILGRYMPKFRYWLVISLIAVVTYGVIYYLQECSAKSKIFMIMNVIRSVSVIASLVIILVFTIFFHDMKPEKIAAASGDGQATASDDIGLWNDDISINKGYGKEYSYSANLDKIKLIRNNRLFQALSYAEKCSVIEAVIYGEAEHLGLCRINVVFEELGSTVMGKYSHNERTIFINSLMVKNSKIGTAKEVLDTIFHECRHCYQHMMADIYASITPEQRALCVFSDDSVGDWVVNLHNYTSSETNINRYLEQSVEADARKYAGRRTTEFWEYITGMLMHSGSDGW